MVFADQPPPGQQSAITVVGALSDHLRHSRSGPVAKGLDFTFGTATSNAQAQISRLLRL